jgi:TonB family protein
MKKFLSPILLSGSLALASVAGAQVVKPKPVSMPSPGYPEALTDTGLNGKAEVDFVVKADGSTGDVELAMATDRAFGRVAVAAVRSWKFEPGSRDGKPVDMAFTIPFVFTAPDDQQVDAVARRKVFVKVAEPVLTQKEYGSRLKVKKEARPMYPPALAVLNLDETVEVSFTIAPDGTTLNPEVVGSPRKEFVIPAMIAVAQMAYAPPVKDGKGVYVATTTKVRFSNESQGGMGGGGGRGGRGGRGGGMGGDSGMGGGFDSGGGMGGGMGGGRF